MRLPRHIKACAALLAALALVLAACGALDGDPSTPAPEAGVTSGPAYAPPEEVVLAPAAITQADATPAGTIDTSTAAGGYVTVAITSQERVKLQVLCGDMSYSYDVPGDGTPITCPLNMGDGSYTFRVMQNTSGNNYVELSSAQADVMLASEFSPFLRPNVYVDYGDQSACVLQARALVGGALNQGDALAAICDYVMTNVAYDADKARQLADATGYIPDPDETLATGRGICFDYSSLSAAMLRSQGIPTKVMTGYLYPDDVYHAWISVNIDGTWKCVWFDIKQGTWSRVDLTLAAGESAGLVGEGKEYADRYTY